MVPTLTVIVPALVSAAVIANAVLCAGSVARGYVWVVALLSRAQVNPNLLAPIVTVLEVVNAWLPIVITKTPVSGVYVASYTAYVALLLSVTASATVPLT